MQAETPPPLSPMETLPVELRQGILSAITDIASLRFAALSCPLLYYAFTAAESMITSRVLINQVGLSVLPEALAALESSLRSRDLQNYMAFAANHLHARLTPSESWRWSLCEAQPIAKLHLRVRYFVNRFANTILDAEPFCLLPDAKDAVPSKSEISRIERALYRFDIYCNLYLVPGQAGFEVFKAQWEDFFRTFSPWENEQLACIHDFLARAVAPAFNEIAEHDIFWGAMRIPCADTVGSLHLQSLLYRGLEALYHIATAETYELKHKFLHCGEQRPNIVFFLNQGLLCHANEVNDGPRLRDYSPQDERSYIQPPFFNDPDTGPADIWRWAHQDETCSSFVNQRNRQELRQYGYVMWNQARLDAVGLSRTSFAASAARLPIIVDDAQRTRVKASWGVRSSIYAAGGRGYWSDGDSGEIIWRRRRKYQEKNGQLPAESKKSLHPEPDAPARASSGESNDGEVVPRFTPAGKRVRET